MQHDTDSIINTTLDLLDQDDQNEMLYDFFCHLTLASASCDTNRIVNGTTVLMKARQLKQYATEQFGYVMPLMLVSVSHDAKCHQWHNPTGQDYQKKMQHDPFGHVMPLATASASCDVNGIINSTTAFVKSR